ncbi:DNA primase, partial [Salmonella enterica subsp. enterica serovar Typhimurium]|nr:DNA primase [Salmonella enterica subsp. enterica serovar Typhimurium]
RLRENRQLVHLRNPGKWPPPVICGRLRYCRLPARSNRPSGSDDS